MSIFNFFKRKKNVSEDNNVNVTNEFIFDNTNSLSDEVQNTNGMDGSSKDSQEFDFSDSKNYILFSDEEYANDLNIDKSFYDNLLKEEEPQVDELELSEEEKESYNVFNIESSLEEIEKKEKEEMASKEVDYEFHDKPKNDEESGEELVDLSNDSIEDPKINNDLFSYLDDPFLVDNFLNRDSFSFQKFLDDKKKANPDNANLVVDLEDEDQRLDFIREIETNIIDSDFQNSDLINDKSVKETIDESAPIVKYEGSFDDLKHVEGADLYKAKIPSSIFEAEEKEIILEDIFIPEVKKVEKAPTNNFRDFFANDDGVINNPSEINYEKPYDNSNNSLDFSDIDEDPIYIKDSLKNNDSLNNMINYTKEFNPIYDNKENDVIEDFYDIPEEPKLDTKETTPEISEDELISKIKTKNLINEIKLKYEQEIIMDSKRRANEANAEIKRPNFNDELLDVIRKGFPN